MSPDRPSPDTDSPGQDRCPGALRIFPADDGGIARIRIPGGRLGPQDWSLFAELATDLGDGELHLTSRGAVQIRGIAAEDADELAQRLTAAGRLPSPDHDRARSILASPLAGRAPGRAPVDAVLTELAEGFLARPALASLSGRFLLGLDDGSGDVLAHSPDLGAVAEAGGETMEVVVAGARLGRSAAASDVAALVLDLAEHVAAHRGEAWRVVDAPDLRADLVARVAADERTHCTPRSVDAAATRPEVPRVGWLDCPDGTVSLLAVTPHAVVPARLAEFLGAIDRPSTVSADRVIGLHELTEEMAEQVVRVLAPMGLVFDAASPWVEVTACTGRPGCGRSLADVRYDSASAIAAGTLPVSGPQHWVGCERRCGYDGRSALVRASADGPEVYVVEEASEP